MEFNKNTIDPRMLKVINEQNIYNREASRRIEKKKKELSLQKLKSSWNQEVIDWFPQNKKQAQFLYDEIQKELIHKVKSEKENFIKSAELDSLFFILKKADIYFNEELKKYLSEFDKVLTPEQKLFREEAILIKPEVFKDIDFFLDSFIVAFYGNFSNLSEKDRILKKIQIEFLKFVKFEQMEVEVAQEKAKKYEIDLQYKIKNNPEESVIPLYCYFTPLNTDGHRVQAYCMPEDKRRAVHEMQKKLGIKELL